MMFTQLVVPKGECRILRSSGSSSGHARPPRVEKVEDTEVRQDPPPAYRGGDGDRSAPEEGVQSHRQRRKRIALWTVT